MTKKEENYNAFLTRLKSDDVKFVQSVADFMRENNYAYKAEHKKTLSQITFSNKKTKKAVVSFTLKDEVLFAKIIGDNVNKYEAFLDTLPYSMIEQVERSPLCKQLVDPSACWQACEMGLVFTMKEEELSKCRYHSFSFQVENEIVDDIFEFIKQENTYQLK